LTKNEEDEMKTPDTNPVDVEALRKITGSDAWDKLEAVIHAAIGAAARGDIEIEDAESVIRVGISNARLALLPTEDDPRWATLNNLHNGKDL